MIKDIVIVSAARTPITAFGGGFKDLTGAHLAAAAMNAAIERAGVEKSALSDVIFGNCIQDTNEPNVARCGAIKAGIPVEVPAFTIQRQCDSGMTAVVTGAQQIQCGDAEIVLAGGVESYSTAPFLLRTARWGQRLKHGEMTDSIWEMLHSGGDIIMGETAELLAEKHGVSRKEQDEVALRSHNNAEAAINEGRFKDEIVPVEVPRRRKDPIIVDTDEHVRLGLTWEDLEGLKPAFKKGGTVTAANSSGLNDGAAAMILMSREKAESLGLKPLAKIIGHGIAGVEPNYMGEGPIPATERAFEKTGLSLGDIELIEVNEAFASQYIVVERGLGLNREITNVNGSGCALGHPVGSTGCRIMVTLIHEMARRDLTLGLATLCAGGGMGMTTILSREV